MFNPNEHMISLKGKDYLQVAWRLVWFRDQDNGAPGYGIQTEMLEHGDDWAVFRCNITDATGRVVSTGHGSESRKDFGDYLEKAETKAVGRALAMLGYGTQFAADELDEGERIVDSPISRKQEDKRFKTADKCEECGQFIIGVPRRDGSKLTADKIKEMSMGMFKKKLCYECALKKEREAKAAADEEAARVFP